MLDIRENVLTEPSTTGRCGLMKCHVIKGLQKVNDHVRNAVANLVPSRVLDLMTSKVSSSSIIL